MPNPKTVVSGMAEAPDVGCRNATNRPNGKACVMPMVGAECAALKNVKKPLRKEVFV